MLCSLALCRSCLNFQYFRVDALTYVHRISIGKVKGAMGKKKNTPAQCIYKTQRNCWMEKIVRSVHQHILRTEAGTPDMVLFHILSAVHSNKSNPQNILPGSAKIIFLTPSISRVAKVVGRLRKRKAIYDLHWTLTEPYYAVIFTI